jgi:hypothetical protein
MNEPIVQVCKHDAIERHKGLPALTRSSTRPTAKIEKLQMARIEIDLEDADAVAGFLELAASIMRAKRRIVILIE